MTHSHRDSVCAESKTAREERLVPPVEGGESARAETARGPTSGDASAKKRKQPLRRSGSIDVVRDGAITPRAQGGDVATLECWLNDMLGRSIAKVPAFYAHALRLV